MPGFPQILRRKQHLPGSVLFFFGTGALIAMMISLVISGGNTRAFDSIYVIASPYLYNAYPTNIHPSAPSADTLVPIHPPGEPSRVQPFFRELWYFHIMLYGVCAAISFWDQWRQKSAEVNSSA